MNFAFENIWDEFNIPLKSYIKKRVNNDQDIEDIHQTVFLKIINNLPNLKNTDKIYAWVYSITRNTIIDYYKSRKADLNIEDYTDEILYEPDSDSIADNEMKQCVSIMIQQLPDIYKEAIILTEFQNLTQKELAIRMGISIPGAKSRVQRAREYLKKMLLDCCNFEKDHNGNVMNYKRKDKTCDYC